MRKRALAIAVGALVVAGVAGGAYAASQSSTNPDQSVINDAAKRLHVTPSQLSSALKQAVIDRLNAAVKAGHLTQSQANALMQRIQHGPGLPLGLGLLGPGPGPLGPAPGFMGPRMFHGRGFGAPPMFFHPPLLGSVAPYLGLTQKQLFQQLRSGKSLAQIATAHGKTTNGLEQTLTKALRAHLDAAVKAGRLPRAVEQHLLQMLEQHVRAMITMAPGSGPSGFQARPHFYFRPGGKLPPRSGGPGGGWPPPGGAGAPPPRGAFGPPPPASHG